jgi:glycosyltransferase involved in cell wall biosynthesis
MTGALRRSTAAEVTIVTSTPSNLGSTEIPQGLSIRGPETNLEEVISRAAAVHIHGLWQRHTRRGALIAQRAGVPYLIAAHGMAEPWALRHKRWKKSFYFALVESKNLRRASCLHALSRPEIDHLRELAPQTPICFVPNGVDLVSFDDLPERSILEERIPELRGKFVLLFFGRLHAKKGLDLLAGALGLVAHEFPDLHVLIAGKDDGAWQPFSHRVEALGLSPRITYLGHVQGNWARKVWARADAFILPSYSEGFSMAILEALACSLPCLITTACHFPELAEAEGAIITEPRLDAVTEGLRTLLTLSTQERVTLGTNGRELITHSYTWDQQAQQLGLVYKWLAGGSEPPSCVIL